MRAAVVFDNFQWVHCSYEWLKYLDHYDGRATNDRQNQLLYPLHACMEGMNTWQSRVTLWPFNVIMLSPGNRFGKGCQEDKTVV